MTLRTFSVTDVRPSGTIRLVGGSAKSWAFAVANFGARLSMHSHSLFVLQLTLAQVISYTAAYCGVFLR